MAGPSRQQPAGQCEIRASIGRLLRYRVHVDDPAPRHQVADEARDLDDRDLAVVPDIDRSAVVEGVAPEEALEPFDDVVDVAPAPRLRTVAINGDGPSGQRLHRE